MTDGGRDPLAGVGTERLELLVVTEALASAVLSGDLSRLPDGLAVAEGWPTADTVNGLRFTWDRPGARANGGSRVVVLRETGQIIGDLGWKGEPDESGTTEIGYGFAAPSRGHGYGTEAVGAFVQWALDSGGASALTAEVHPDNLPSRRLLERLGFTLDHVETTALWYVRTGRG